MILLALYLLAWFFMPAPMLLLHFAAMMLIGGTLTLYTLGVKGIIITGVCLLILFLGRK
jgi:hypothetical protein